MTSPRQAVVALAIASLLAGAGMGYSLCRWIHADPPPAIDTTDDLVRKYTERYDLTRDQQRLVWMIVSEQRREEAEYLQRQVEEARSQVEAREAFARIGRRADERILAILEPDQRSSLRAETTESTDRTK